MAKTLAEIQEQLDALHTESRGALSKTVAYVCPFNCAEQYQDEYGYCRHLVGFTSDRKSYEPVAPLFRRTADGTPYDTGFKQVGGRRECEPGDRFVNPERPQVVGGIAGMARAWVSDRVYREHAAAAEPALPPVQQVSQIMALQSEASDLRKRLEEKKLREEITKMRQELAEAELEEATRP